MAAPRPRFDCPVCGEDVPAGAMSCPGCGACDKSGWSGDAAYDTLDLPDGEFDYDEFASRQFGEPRKPKPRERLWWWAALIALIAFAWLIFVR